jgi:penicillin-binding protein 2
VDQRIVDRSNGEYLPGDYIGVTGLEEEYESSLKGQKGAAYILKDNLGRKVGSFNKGSLDSAAISGDNISLSVDLELQEYAESLMKNKQGAIIALEPSTGEILAMVSSPFYDPGLLSIKRNRGAAFDSLAADTLKPFFNRAIMAKYPPASIFKSVVSLIALQENILEANQTIRCPGYYEFGNQVFGCREHPRPRNVSIALQWSCNTYFFKTYQEIIDRFGFNRPDLGLNLFNDYLETFGLGKPIGIDIPGEENGNVPDPAFFNKKYPSKWYSSYILSMGIGQGEIELTTLQMANLAAMIANHGYFYPPHFIRSINGDKAAIPEFFQTKKEGPIDKDHFQPVIDGMELAVAAGTARRSYVTGLDICGKTGTSQNPFGEDHSVFFGFAPKDNPKIAVAVYVENAGSGGAFAAPISSFIMEKYLNDTIMPRRKYLEEYILKTPTGRFALKEN